MYLADLIENALLHVVGWSQSYNPDTMIDDDLLKSESGLRFQTAHPLLTLDNMQAIMPENYGDQFYPYENFLPYTYGNIVYTTDENGNKTYWKYINLTTATGKNPTSEPFYWRKYNILSSFVEQITRDGVTTAVQQFITQKQLTKETKNLLEHRTLFDGAGRLKALVTPMHKIVGLEIVPVRSYSITTVINQIGLQMFGAEGNVRLYLFQSGNAEPLATMDCEVYANGTFKWFFPDDWILRYIDENVEAGGAWYVVYCQDELPVGMQAVNKQKDWSKEPCNTCTGYVDLMNWRELTKYVQVSPFMVSIPDGWLESPYMWDTADMAYTKTSNYGLNLNLTIGCDLSFTIFDQRLNFANVIQKQVATTALRTLALNPSVRVNRNQSNASAMDILAEIDGDTRGTRPNGLGYQLEEAYKALSLDMRNIDRICLSCNNGGVKYRTV